MWHQLSQEQRVARPRGEVFAFFSDAGNLERITPPELGFNILTPRPILMAPGTLIDYRLTLFGFRFEWQTRIETWDPPHSFSDTQVKGPYKDWIHTHRFREDGSETIMTDEVRYRLPLTPLGDITYPVIRFQLARIFAHRRRVIEELLVDDSPPRSRSPDRR